MATEKLTIRIDKALKDQLRGYADKKRTTMSEVAETAIDEYLDPAAYRNLSLQYLERIDRKYSTTLKRVDLVVEMLSLLTRVWFRRHPKPEDDAVREQLKAQGERLFEQFTQLLEQRIASGRTFQRAFDDRIFDNDDFPDS